MVACQKPVASTEKQQIDEVWEIPDIDLDAFPLTSTEKQKIEFAHTEIQEILNADPDSFPEAIYAFDNETAAEDAEKVDAGKVWDYFPNETSSRYGKEITDETLREVGLLLRYNRGRYYTVNYTTEGKLLFVLFSENENGVLSRAVIHIVAEPGNGLGSAKKFYSVARPGATRYQIDRVVPSSSNYMHEGMLNVAVYLLDDMTMVLIPYWFKEGKEPETATKRDVFITSDEWSYGVSGKGSVLPYLLPQDLALIS
jgi:hypothetical protein